MGGLLFPTVSLFPSNVVTLINYTQVLFLSGFHTVSEAGLSGFAVIPVCVR